jgi:hypothetical protein
MPGCACCRTHVVRIFPNAESCLRLIRALAVEMHENWLEAHRYLNMDDLRGAQEGGPAHGRLSRFANCHVDNAARCPQGPTTTATMIRICRTLWTQHSTWAPRDRSPHVQRWSPPGLSRPLFGRCCERTSSPRDGSLHGAQGLWFGRVAAKARIVRRLGGRERMSRMSRADRWKEGTCGLSSLACSKVSESGRKVANIAGSSHRATRPNAHRRASPPSGSSLVLHVDSPREPATGCLPVHHMPGRPSRMRREKSGAPAAARARSLIRLARRSSAKGRPWSSAPYS